jgi:hypothetical protein
MMITKICYYVEGKVKSKKSIIYDIQIDSLLYKIDQKLNKLSTMNINKFN